MGALHRLLLIACFLLVAAAVDAAPKRYDGMSLVRCSSTAARWWFGADRHIVVLEEEDVGRHRHVDLLVPTAQRASLARSMMQLGCHVVLPDVQKAIDAERRPRSEAQWWEPGRDGGFFDTFREWDEYVEYVDLLIAAYPSLLTKFTAGYTYENREIIGVKVSTGGSNHSSIWVEAQQHAREWLAGTTNLWIMTGLVEEYEDGNAQVVQYLNAIDFYFVPLINIDGYIYTWNGDRMWRKNRSVNSGSQCLGIDLNRNWDVETCSGVGSSTNPCSDTYCGMGAFTAPETQAMSENMRSLASTLLGGLDLHTYGPLLLYPYQKSYDATPEPHRSMIQELGSNMEDAINAVHRTGFEAIQGSDLYPHDGGFIDWVYEQFDGIPSFTAELRGNSFIVPDSDIVESGEEFWEGFLVFINHCYNSI